MADTYTDYLAQLDRLYLLNTSKMMKLGLEQPRALYQAIGSPADRLNIIHVAGTNGKGSVCFKLAAALQKAGYKVGLFSSPHISTFRERIRVNGQMITEEEVAIGLEKLFAVDVPTTFFEVTTVLALDYFAQQNVDWVVLETGLGGRLDATNIVVPKVCTITSIGFDHCQFLGDTLEAITREKAGIIKENVPVVVGPSVPVEYIERCDLHQVVGPFGDYEKENRAIAEKVLELLDIPSNEAVKSVPPCRFEKINFNGSEYILDVAHNPQGLQRLFERVGGKKLPVICGLSNGKDLKASLETILQYTDQLYLVSGNHERLESVEALKRIIPNRYTQAYPSVSSAIESIEPNGNPVIICGSFFIMAEARKSLGITEETDAKDLQECISPVRK